MKTVIGTSLLLLVLVFCLPLLFIPSSGTDSPTTPVPSPVSAVSPPNVPSPTPSPHISRDLNTKIRLSQKGKVENVSMLDYLVGVVAAEMPASFNMEALKAQAVAARTYAIYEIKSSKHSGFDLCDDFGCCSAFASLDELRSKWGDSYNTYLGKITEAVKGTDGLYLTFENKPILAAFHAASYGSTESSENVWSSALPYLVSASTPETPEKVTNLFSIVTVSQNNFKETILSKYPEAVFGPDPKQWISLALYSKSGRVTSLRVGGVKMTGAQLRLLFGLRSAAFTYEVENDAIVFKVSGYGHGVGMSQYGANIMSASGSKFDEILENYYKGVQISSFLGNFKA